MELEQALANLLPGGRSGDEKADMLAALRESWQRRRRNSENGGAVIAALVDPQIGGMTYRQLAEEVGIPLGTLHRWQAAPGSTAAEVPET